MSFNFVLYTIFQKENGVVDNDCQSDISSCSSYLSDDGSNVKGEDKSKVRKQPIVLINISYFEFINIRCIPIFRGFCGYTWTTNLNDQWVTNFLKEWVPKPQKSNIHEYVGFPQTTKIDTYKKKSIYSKLDAIIDLNILFSLQVFLEWLSNTFYEQSKIILHSR